MTMTFLDLDLFFRFVSKRCLQTIEGRFLTEAPLTVYQKWWENLKSLFAKTFYNELNIHA